MVRILVMGLLGALLGVYGGRQRIVPHAFAPTHPLLTARRSSGPGRFHVVSGASAAGASVNSLGISEGPSVPLAQLTDQVRLDGKLTQTLSHSERVSAELDASPTLSAAATSTASGLADAKTKQSSASRVAQTLPNMPRLAGLVPSSTNPPPRLVRGMAAVSLGIGVVGAAVVAARRKKRTGMRATGFGAGGAPEEAVPFEIRGFSLAQTFLLGGVFLTAFSVLDYTVLSASGSGFGLGGVTFIYAIPVFVLGAALQYAELKPVEVETEPDAVGLFDELATETMQKIKQDVTRHRYGDDAHLDTSLKALQLVGVGRYPQLKKIIESKSDSGELQMTMLFESKEVPFTQWADPQRIVACDRFFGPGLWSEIFKYSSEKRMAALRLTTGSRPSDDEDKKK